MCKSCGDMKHQYDSLAHLKDDKTGKYDLKLHSKKRKESIKKAMEKMKK